LRWFSGLHPKNFLNRHFRPAVKDTGIVDFRWHDLRHTFASRLTMASGDLRTVQELMGHQTITMTIRYAHLAPSHLREAVLRISRGAW
jgi:site-specific recombinase XerC